MWNSILFRKSVVQVFIWKNYPIHSKTLLRIVNEDLANSCKLCGIRENIKSHSFRVSVISKLLQVTTVQNVASIVGHRDIRSTMCYDRYRLSKVAIQEIYSEAETEVDSKINKYLQWTSKQKI
jgi:site-specific recombinase XerD